MKTCQCCGALASADALHCSRCGEASWTPAVLVLVPDRESQAIFDALMAEPAREVPPPNVEPPAVLVPEAPPLDSDASRAPSAPRRRRGPANP